MAGEREQEKKKEDALRYLESLGLEARIEDLPAILEGECLVFSCVRGQEPESITTHWSISEEE